MFGRKQSKVKTRILFVEAKNDFASQMAEYFTRQLYDGMYDAYSAGPEKDIVDCDMITAMYESGEDIRRQISKDFKDRDFLREDEEYDVVVYMDRPTFEEWSGRTPWKGKQMLAAQFANTAVVDEHLAGIAPDAVIDASLTLRSLTDKKAKAELDARIATIDSVVKRNMMPEVSPNYRIILTREKELDNVLVEVEIKPEFFTDSIAELESIRRRAREAIAKIVGIRMEVKIVEPNTIARSEGKAKRVIDMRKI